jgi:hypothetical protein
MCHFVISSFSSLHLLFFSLSLSSQEAAVISVHSQKWMERPWACVVVKQGETLTYNELLDYLRPRVYELLFCFPPLGEFFSSELIFYNINLFLNLP